MHYLEDSLPANHPFHGIHASPTGAGMPEVWCLGSSTDSAYVAATMGLPFSFAQFIAPETGELIALRSVTPPIETSDLLAQGLVEARASWLLTFGAYTAETATSTALVRDQGFTATVSED